MKLPYFDAAEVRASLPFDRAIAAIEDALRGQTDPEIDGPRIFAPAPDGEFLLMPAIGQGYTGLKVATIAPLNPAKGEEKIQGVYLLFGSSNLTPIASMDGAELTAIRTPAATLTAVKNIADAPGDTPFTRTPKVLVFGAGIQAVNHIRAAKAVFPEGTFCRGGPARRAHPGTDRTAGRRRHRRHPRKHRGRAGRGRDPVRDLLADPAL